MVEVVCRLHHVSSGGDQGKFLRGGASAWALLEKFQSGEAGAWASSKRSKGDGAKGGAAL